MSALGPDITTLLSPERVAVIGSLSRPDRMGARTVRHLTEAEFPGDVQECAGVADLEGSVDVAVVAVPAPAVPGILTSLDGRADHVIVYSSGFEETGAEVLDAPAGMGLLGPNTVGAYWARSRAVLTFAQAFDDLVDCPTGPGVAVISQSGAFGARVLRAARNRGLIIDGFVATGNEDGFTAVHVLSGLCSMPDKPRVVGLYLESVADGPALSTALQAARAADVQVVVLNGGRTPVSAAAATSHTAAVSADHEVLEELFRMEGAVVVDSDRALVDALIGCALATLVPGRNVAVVTGSGGAGVVAADLLSTTAAEVPAVSEELDTRLSDLLPHYASWVNPVDVTASVIGDTDGVGSVIDALVASGEFAVVLAVGRAEQAADFQRRGSDQVRVVTALLDGSDRVVGDLVRSGTLALGDLEAGARAASFLTSDPMPIHDRRRPDRVRAEMPTAPLPAPVDDVVSSLEAIEAAGIAAAPWRHVHDVEAALAALDVLGGPVVVKANLPAEAHKASSGGIRLDVTTHSAMQDVATALLSPSGSAVVAKQVRGGPELFVGVRRDPLAGRVVSIGLGGGAVELISRTVTVPAAASEAWRFERVHQAVFGGSCRWRPTAAALSAIGERMLDLAERIDAELVEINPFVETDSGLVALDARVLRRGQR